MKMIMNIFKFLFCKKKQITCLDGLPTEIRYIILAYWYENRIFKTKEKFVEFTSHNWYGRIPKPYDDALKVVVNKNNDFCFTSQKFTQDFITHFGSTGLEIVQKQIRSKIIRQHIESYIMSLSFPFPYDLSGIGHMYMYYHVKELLRGLVVQLCDNSRDVWLHYLTIEYVSSDASRKIRVHANWNLELFKLQMDSDTFVEIPGNISYYNFYENVESKPKICQFFKSLGDRYTMKILDEGLLGSGPIALT